MVTIKRKKLVNPHRPKKSSGKTRAKRSTQKKRNPGYLMSLGYLNPQRRKPMKKRKTARRKNPAKVVVFRKKNPTRSFRRRRNPARSGVISSSTGMFKNALLLMLGLLITRQVPQAVLKEKNTGILGYGSNLLTALVAGGAIGKTLGRAEGQFVGLGGALYVINRLLTEQFSPIGKMLSLSGVGDYAATGKLGQVVPAYFPTPVQYDSSGQPTFRPRSRTPCAQRCPPLQRAAARPVRSPE